MDTFFCPPFPFPKIHHTLRPMATSTFLLSLLPILLSLLIANTQPAVSCFDSIFSFGDSLTDTGNLIHSPSGHSDHAARLPYGETYFHSPTGRFSDGRLVLDFIAEAMGLPFVPPFLMGGASKGQDFRHGANFAVGGATALDSDFFREKGLNVTWHNYSLGVQVEWFKKLLPSLCSSNSDCNHVLSKSLFIVGEIGGNDYNYPFLQGRNVDEIETYAPQIINATSSAIIDLIDLGATTLIVPGEVPFGCNSAYLTIFGSKRKEDYDPQTGCIKWLNELSEKHSQSLLKELGRIRHRYPYATIIYADYYNTIINILSFPYSYGFGNAPLASCCGGGGPYNYNSSAECGDENVRVCDDPSRYAYWDGFHFTEAAYRWIANGLLNGPLRFLANSKCSHLEPKVQHTQKALQSI